MIRALYFSPRSKLQLDFPVDQFKQALRQKQALLWVDFCGEPNSTCEPVLQEIFKFHPLAIDDALRETHTPKVDDWGEYLYIVLSAMDLDESITEGSVHEHELDVFLGTNFLVTHHDDPIPAMDQVWDACQRDERHIRSGPDHLLYKIVDYIVAAYMPIVERIDANIDDLEDRIFDRPEPGTLEALFQIKRALLSMRRVIMPQREVMNKLARDDYRVIDENDRVFFRDVYDHLVRLHDLNESMRDLVTGALETYLSVINNRMNDVMKTLTTITTIFMPISFVVGFFGMNFFEPVAHLVDWTDRLAFYITLAVLFLTPMVMFVWMRKRKWV